MSIEDNLKSYMESKGLPCNKDILIDGKIHRYSCRPGKDTSEWYIATLLDDNKVYCVFKSWREEEKYIWRSYETYELPDENKRLEAIEDEILAEEYKITQEQIEKATKFYNNSNICLSHPYLSAKKVKPHNCKIKDGTLIIPLYNIEGKLTSLQFIFFDVNENKFKKKFKAGISPIGLSLTLGDINLSKKFIVCEGFATGASIYENTNIPVVIAFSANNALIIGKSFQNIYPNKSIALAVDNDKKGLETLNKWKDYISDLFYMPTKDGYDFNDMYCNLPKADVDKIFRSEPIKALNIAQILTEQCDQEIWLNSIICKSTFNIIYGKGGLGKSRLAYEMAYSLCTNEQFLYFQPYGNFKVLYVDGEMSSFEIKARMKDIIERHDESDIDENNFKILKSSDVLNQLDTDLDLYNPEHRERLEKLFMDSDIIFLDNFGCLTIPPGGDTYKLDKVEWVNLSSWFKRLRMSGKTIILIMHANKDGKLEGVGKIRNDADLVLELREPELLDTEASCHFKIIYEKARKIPIFEQQTVEAKINRNRKQSFGWIGTKL